MQSPRPRSRPRAEGRVELAPEGLRIGGEVVPLHAAAVHYWRLDPRDWRAALEATKSLGFRLIDVYVPWGVHEIGPGTFDFGRLADERDVAAFVELIGELELYCILRPGPHINAELTGFGLPERVIWDAECQARSPHGNPVVLPVPPLAFPVPSYASETFHSEVARWFHAVGEELARFVYPHGSIVLTQVDNEGALYFRDGVYDQDWHPDSLRKYRRFLQARYEKVAALRQAHRDEHATFTRIEPPKRFDAKHADELAPHLDWAEWQEQMLADSFALMKDHLLAAGLGGVPTSHNLPLSEGATPLDPERIGKVVDLLGLDYYHAASAPQRSEIARRTTDLAERCRARGHSAFACELGAGFPPFFPPLTERDNAFSVLTALAYGLRGFNAYMVVDRDRWVGAPIDSRGKLRPSAELWRKLLAALDRTRFFELSRHAAVHIVVPRSFRRLSRVCHAFGPLSAALFQVLGGGTQEACFEDELGLGSPVVIDTERFARQLEHTLELARIPYAIVGGDLLEHALTHARWSVVVSTGALDVDLCQAIEQAWQRGAPLSLGPYLPTRDASFQMLRTPVGLPAGVTRVPSLLGLGAEALAETVADAKTKLELPALTASPAELLTTVHVDRQGVARVLFVINPTEWAVEAKLGACGAKIAADALDGERFNESGGEFALTVSGRSVRMLELSHSD
ncbi:MAG: beta-galactosidase [Myxococcales bacterium]|nr:beta-galactosidase [Myxococcales bacterium]